MPVLQILVADDHEVVRKGICSVLQKHPGWEVCCEVGDGRLAVDKSLELRPDIVILDIGMPSLNGLEATRRILHTNPEIKVLILTMHESEQVARQVFEAGALGYLLKSDAGSELLTAVQALQYNRHFFTSMVSRNSWQVIAKTVPPTKELLTGREREVLQLVAEGKSSKEIAVELDVSTKTVDTHRSNILRKLDLHTVADLVLYAVKNNIVQVALAQRT
jgi:DNA-binding NarL/FixJ family response regulator